MEMQVNPDPELLKMLVWILVVILVLVIAVLGYFIRKVATTIEYLRDAFPVLQTTINIEIPGIKKDIEAHGVTIKDHETRIVAIENRKISKRNGGN